MYSKEVVVISEKGIHARPAGQFVKLASKYQSKIMLEYNGKSINTKSIMGLLTAAIRYNEKIVICAEGEDEKEAVEALVDFVEHCEE